MTILVMTQLEFWASVVLAGLVGYGLGLITMRLLTMPKKPKKVNTSVEAALRAVEHHKDNKDIAY